MEKRMYSKSLMSYWSSLMTYTLFIDDLHWEMSWGWMKQIFRGEGEVIDVYISQKRRRYSNGKFGFIRFKELEEALNAIRNLDGARIRGRRIKVSFAKYGKNDKLQKDSTMVEADIGAKSVGGSGRHRLQMKDRRSFLEMVEGVPTTSKAECLRTENNTSVGAPSCNELNVLLEKLNLKEMVWRLVEEIFKSIKLEEIKQRLGTLLEMVIHAIQVELSGCRKENDEKQMEGREGTRGVFLEDLLLSSMMHKERDASCTPIGHFETSLPADSVVGPTKKRVMEAELPHCSSTRDNQLALRAPWNWASVLQRAVGRAVPQALRTLYAGSESTSGLKSKMGQWRF